MEGGNRKLEALIKIAVDCGFQVHNDIGPGLLESAYEGFLAAILIERGVQVERQTIVPVTYRGVTVRDAFRADLLLDRTLVIEIKSVDRLAPVHAKQLLTYLRMLEQSVGLLMNFGADMFRNGVKRVLNGRCGYVAPTSF